MNTDTAIRAGKLLRDRRFTSFLALFLISLAAALLSVLAVDNFVVLTSADRFVQDSEIAFLAPIEPSDPRIVVVAVNEDTLAQFPYRAPIDRAFLANLVTKLDAAHPRAIGVDILFDQPTETQKDAALYQALRAAKTPLAVAYTEEPLNVTPHQLDYLRSFVPPGMRALTNLAKDQYGTVRTVFPGAKQAGGHYVPSFERALAARAGVPTNAQYRPIVWHRHPPDQEYGFLEIPAQIAGVYPPVLFKDKVILIGSDVSLDRHRTPFSSVSESGTMPGIMVHAYSLATLLNGENSPYVGWRLNAIIALILAAIGAVLGILNLHLLPRISIMALLLMAFWAVGFTLFHYENLLLGLLAPSIAMIASFSGMDSLTGREARKQRHFIQGAFSRYVAPKVVEALIADPSKMSLEGERRVMTYVFTDIAGFTTFSENMESKELARILNEYLEGMTQIVLRHDGMVDKFIGDAVFAIFNAPVDLAGHAEHAVQCALEMDDFCEEFRIAQEAAGVKFGLTRIGVHTGPAVVGNFGSKERFNYTAQGDAVNTAARLEGLNKEFGTRICVSGDTRAECQTVEFREIASVVLKGKTVPTMVWEPLHAGRQPAGLVERYRAAFAMLAAGEPDAQAAFDALAADAPDDPCIKWHVKRLAGGKQGVEIVMTEK